MRRRLLLAFGGAVGLLLLTAGAVQRRSYELWGIALRKPVDLSAVEVATCVSGREFAFRGGRYRITTDDVLALVPHEHEDTTAALAALDSVRSCMVMSREHRFAALLTLRDSLVTQAWIFWPDAKTRPSVDSVASVIAGRYGAPTKRERGGQEWAADSAWISLGSRGMLSDGTSIAMSDRAACEWFERIVHRRTPRVTYVDAESNDCWVPPKKGATRQR